MHESLHRIESSAEDCPFPANFEEVFLQEFHRRRDERCLAKVKRWCVRQWESCDFRWGSFLGGAATGAAAIALVVSFAGLRPLDDELPYKKGDTEVETVDDKKDVSEKESKADTKAEANAESDSDKKKEKKSNQKDLPIITIGH